jgi:hypothetical protein
MVGQGLYSVSLSVICAMSQGGGLVTDESVALRADAALTSASSETRV